MTITRGGTLSSDVRTITGTDGDISHTVDVGTTLLVVSIFFEAAETVTSAPTWSLGGTLTLVDATTSSSNAADMAMATYALANPTAGAGTVTIAVSSNDNSISTATNYLGTNVSATMTDNIVLIAEDVNDSTTNTTVFSSAGDSGNTLYAAGGFKGDDGTGVTVPTSFFEIFDAESGGGSANADIAAYVCDFIGGAAAACTWTWAATDENSGHYLQILQVPHVVTPSHAELRAWSVTGLQFCGITPTITVTVSDSNHTAVMGAPDALLLTGAASTVIVNHIRVAGAPDALAFTGAAPSAEITHNRAMGAPDALAITGNIPVVSKLIDVPSGSLVTTGNTPVVSHLIDVPVGSLAITGNIPVVSDLIDTGATPLVITGFAPTVTVTDNVEWLDTVALSFTGSAPSVEIDHIRETGTASLTTTGQIPVVSHLVDTPVSALSFTGNAPSVEIEHNRAMGAPDALAFTGNIPTAIDSGAGGVDHTVTPALGTIAFTGNAPVASHLVDLPVASMSFSGFAPTVTVTDNVESLNTVALAITGFAPSAEIDHFRAVGNASLSFSSDANVLGISLRVPTGSINLVGTFPLLGPGQGSISFGSDAPIARIDAGGVSITNPGATTSVPNNYEQCDLTGFRQLPGSMKLTWNNYAVRKKSFESRHPQEFQKDPSNNMQKGSRRPEQEERFLDDNEVTVDDL